MRICFAVRAVLEGICLVALLAWPLSAAAQSPPSFSRPGNEIAHDSRWFVDSIQLDIEDIATSPLYVAAPQSPLRSRRFYLSLTVAAAVWGTSFALDKTIQSGVGHMAHSAHDVMENLSYTMLITAAGGTLMYGLYRDDAAARQNPLTGLEAAGLGVGSMSWSNAPPGASVPIRPAARRLSSRAEDLSHQAIS